MKKNLPPCAVELGWPLSHHDPSPHLASGIGYLLPERSVSFVVSVWCASFGPCHWETKGPQTEGPSLDTLGAALRRLRNRDDDDHQVGQPGRSCGERLRRVAKQGRMANVTLGSHKEIEGTAPRCTEPWSLTQIGIILAKSSAIGRPRIEGRAQRSSAAGVTVIIWPLWGKKSSLEASYTFWSCGPCNLLYARIAARRVLGPSSAGTIKALRDLVYNLLERICPPTWAQQANGTPKWQDLPMLLKQDGSMPGLSGAFSTKFLPARGLSLVLVRPHGEEGSAMLPTPMPRRHQMSLLEPQLAKKRTFCTQPLYRKVGDYDLWRLKHVIQTGGPCCLWPSVECWNQASWKIPSCLFRNDFFLQMLTLNVSCCCRISMGKQQAIIWSRQLAQCHVLHVRRVFFGHIVLIS